MGESPARRPSGAAPGPQGAQSATVLVPASERVPVALRWAAAVCNLHPAKSNLRMPYTGGSEPKREVLKS